jgi:hypothetical protein
MRIRDPGWKKFGSGIRNKHLGSAKLLECTTSAVIRSLVIIVCFTVILTGFFNVVPSFIG